MKAIFKLVKKLLVWNQQLQVQELMQVHHEKFFEIYNGHPGINWEGDASHPGHEKIWDIANTLRIAEFKANQAKGMKAQFIFDKIAETEQVSVTEQELSAWLIQQAPRYGMAPQQLADLLVKNGNVNMAIADIRRAKALEVVLKAAHVVDSKGNVVDLNALDEDMAALS